MKDVFFYVFLFVLYGILALNFNSNQDVLAPVLTWKDLGVQLLVFAFVATLARWSVIAFKRRPDRLLSGQKIVGIEEGEGDHVIDIVKPKILKRELKKPKLKRKQRL